MSTAEKFDQPGPLMRRTQALLKEQAPRETDLFNVHDQTKIPFYWLRRFVGDGFKNPSVNRVQFLYEHLTKSKLLSE